MSAVTLTVPELETERTIMRAWRADDLDAMCAWTSDAEVMRFLGGVASADQSWRTMALYVGHWQLRGYGLWAVQRKSDLRVIGRVGLWNPAGWPGIEVGWTFAREAWGAGYATECGQATLDWGFTTLTDLDQIIALIVAENAASRRVAERLGMAQRGTHLLMDAIDCLVYGVDRPAERQATRMS